MKKELKTHIFKNHKLKRKTKKQQQYFHPKNILNKKENNFKLTDKKHRIEEEVIFA